MSDVATQEPDSIAHKRMQLKIKRDEKELEDLLKGVTGEAEPEEVKEEVQAESKDEPKQESVDTKSESEETPKEEIEPEPKTQEEKTFKKRYGDIRRHLATKEQEYESKIAELKKQLNSAANNELVTKLARNSELRSNLGVGACIFGFTSVTLQSHRGHGYPVSNRGSNRG